MRSLIVAALSSLFLVGCVIPHRVRVNNVHLQNPFTEGQALKGRFGLALSNVSEVVIFDRTGLSSVSAQESLANIGPANSLTLSARANLGVFERFDIGYSDGIYLRGQFLGEPGVSPGLKGTIQVDSGSAYETGSISNGLFDFNLTEINSKIKHSRLGTSIGYGLDNQSVVYSALARKWTSAKTTATQNSTNSIELQDTGELSTWTVGYFRQGTSKMYLNLEAGLSEISWSRAENKRGFIYGVEAGFYW